MQCFYIQRWEIEMCYREIKSDLQGCKIFWKQQPDLVIKNCGGVFIAYNIFKKTDEVYRWTCKGESF